MKGERGYSRSNKWILENQQVGNIMQQVEKGSATSGICKLQQVEKVILVCKYQYDRIWITRIKTFYRIKVCDK